MGTLWEVLTDPKQIKLFDIDVAGAGLIAASEPVRLHERSSTMIGNMPAPLPRVF